MVAPVVGAGGRSGGGRPPLTCACVGHPFVDAMRPLLDAIGAELVPATDATDGDVPLAWDGETVAVVRLPDMNDALDRQVTLVESELGGRLGELPFEAKRRAVAMLEARGAFTVRKGVERVADAMGVSRFTIYSYLNASKVDAEGTDT